MSQNRVLSLSMRPKSFDELVGQSNLVNSLYNQFVSGRLPHFFILHAQPGAGKTTLSRILALLIQTGKDDCSLTDEDWNNYKKYDIQEINAANKNGVDDIRHIIEQLKYRPIKPSRAKIVIMDEAHQLTSAAQNALLTETEDVLDHIYFIFCTTALNKIIPALQRRAYIVSPTPLHKEDIRELIKKAAEVAEYDDVEELNKLHKSVIDQGISSPGLILQACEKLFSGLPVESCFNSSMESASMDIMPICRAVAKGDWKETAGLIKTIMKADIIGIKQAVLGYLKAILLKSVSPKSLNIARAIKAISEVDDGLGCVATFMASMCFACEYCKA